MSRKRRFQVSEISLDMAPNMGLIARTIQTHYLQIVNFFHNRSTNAASEAFNAKIKAFRRQFRGVGVLLI